MRLRCWAPLAVSAAFLASCGGGDVGSAGSIPVTPTPSPSPTNTSLLDLQANQTFTGNADGMTTAFDLTNQTVLSGTSSAETLTVSYDAAAKSYTVSTAGRTQTFAPGDISATTTNDTQYRKNDGTNRDYLTLVKTPYSDTSLSKYVAVGYWQRNVVTGARQDTLFDVFTYGFPTAAGAVPRTGTASFTTSAFGLTATPGVEPRIFEGRGSFSADLLSGVFSVNIPLTESGLLSGNAINGGGIELIAAGKVGSDGTFAGNMLYGGSGGSISGTLNGRFYGPGAEEVGAAFAGNNSSGATVDGAFTGQRNDSLPAVNQTLTNLIAPQLFFSREAVLTFTDYEAGGSPQARTTTLTGQLNRALDGSFTYGPGESDLPTGTFTAASIVASSDPNFVSYQATFNGQPVMLDLYKPGPTNSELVLTYATFGRWSSTAMNGGVAASSQVYFAYGLETPARLLAAKTGTGHYAGVAYGAGANQTTGALYDVKGTSAFDVDFSRQSYSGALALKGTSTNGAAAVDFGNFTFAGPLSAFTAQSATDLMQNGQALGQLTQQFYGPDGEEIAGPFTIVVPGSAGSGLTAIAGVTVAKRQ